MFCLIRPFNTLYCYFFMCLASLCRPCYFISHLIPKRIYSIYKYITHLCLPFNVQHSASYIRSTQYLLIKTTVILSKKFNKCLLSAYSVECTMGNAKPCKAAPPHSRNQQYSTEGELCIQGYKARPI